MYKILQNEVSKASSDKVYFDWLTRNGLFASAFPVVASHNLSKRAIANIGVSAYEDLVKLSNDFAVSFYNAGVMINGNFYTEELHPQYFEPKTHRLIRIESEVDEKYFINGSLEKWKYLKD